MSDVTCSGCEQVMDQSDVCSHFCPPSEPTRLDIAELRNMIRNLQLSVARIEAALEKKGKP